ncbi:MAG: MIP/aquaporin family protein [Pseudomonadota bacterium]
MDGALTRRLVAEGLGTAVLLATVVGSGIMGDQLSGGNVAVALLANSVATGAILFVLITILGPISGAHFNPAVTLAFALRREISAAHAALYIAVQCVAGVVGVIIAHGMFAMALLQVSSTVRAGPAQGFAEVVATFGLVFTILGGIHWRPAAVPALVGLYITAAYWFTASTSFANPAVTIARTFTDSFAGIAPGNALPFILAQILGAVLAVALAGYLFRARA